MPKFCKRIVIFVLENFPCFLRNLGVFLGTQHFAYLFATIKILHNRLVARFVMMGVIIAPIIFSGIFAYGIIISPNVIAVELGRIMTSNNKKARSNDPGNANRGLLFSQRYGYAPLPDVMDHTLCRAFRNKLSQIYEASLFMGYEENDGSEPYHKDTWNRAWLTVQENILDVPYNSLGEEEFQNFQIDDEEHHILISLIEVILRKGELIDEFKELFALGLAPYRIDDSVKPICIIPTISQENADEIVSSIEALHKDNERNAHDHLRQAAHHVNFGNFREAVQESTNAVESIARGMTGESSLGNAVKKLHSKGIIKEAQLKTAIDKIFGYSSHVSRHGQPADRNISIERDDAVLVFSLCASIAGYLSALRRGQNLNDEDQE